MTVHHAPRLNVDRGAVRDRFQAVLDAQPGTAFREALVRAATDIPFLLAEVDRLWTLVNTARLDRANLMAAGRAALAAHRDGERDPLFYLRDEIDAQERRTS